MMTHSSADAGRWGEKVGAGFLKRAGYKVLGKRIRISANDELDIVARDGDILVFVEVKMRRNEDFGRPGAAVDRRKRHAISRAAVRYLEKLGYPQICFRFDVIEVIGSPGDRDPTVRHIENAFHLDKRYQLPY